MTMYRMMRETLGGVRRLVPRRWRHQIKSLLYPLTDRLTPMYSNTGEEEVIRRLVSEVHPPKFCVDIGASDGRTMSNTLALYQAGWAGLSIEMDGYAFRALAKRHHRFAESSLFRGRVTPDNVLDLLVAAGVPVDLGFLSLDIDGYDYFVLDNILSGFRPAIICTEINEKIPPPLRFTVNYRSNHVSDGSHFYGQSICQLALLCERYDYVFVQLEYNNAFLMPKESARVSLDAQEAYATGYARRLDRRAKFPWNDDMEVLQDASPSAAIDLLNARFAKYAGRYTLDVG